MQHVLFSKEDSIHQPLLNLQLCTPQVGLGTAEQLQLTCQALCIPAPALAQLWALSPPRGACEVVLNADPAHAQ